MWGSDVDGLAEMMEDVEHVILELEEPATMTAGVGGVLAAARRSRRVVTIVGGGVGSVGAAVEVCG